MSDRRLGWIPWVLLVSLLLGSVLVWRGVNARSEADRRRHFDSLVRHVSDSLRARISLSRLGGLGSSALFDASEEVRRDEFHRYVDAVTHIDLPARVSTGYVEVVPREELEEFVRVNRREGMADYDVFPKGDREHYYPVRFAEPPEVAVRALGFDVASDPEAWAVYEEACDKGELLLSGPIDLVEDLSHAPGFLVVTPIYSPGPTPRTREERRLRCHGWAYLAVTEVNLVAALDDILGESRDQVEVWIYAGTEEHEGTLLHTGAGATRRGRHFLEETRTIDLPGIVWTLRMRTAPSWMFADPEDDPALVLYAGVALSFALFGVAYSLVRTRGRAMALAREMTVDLRRRTDESERRGEELARSREATAKAAEALMGQAATLARADRLAAVGEVGAGLAHELRNPLAGIQMTLQNLRREVTDTDQAERLQKVVGEIERLSHLLSQHLSAARHTPEASAPVAFPELIRDLCDVARPGLPERVVLERDVEPGLTCELPRDRVRQALLNLVLNAVQAIGDRPGRVWITAKRDGARVTLSVSDDGPGFPDEMLGKPIGPFVSHRVGGTGLGLATVRRLAMDLQGSLRLENREEGGARVVLELPFVEGSSP